MWDIHGMWGSFTSDSARMRDKRGDGETLEETQHQTVGRVPVVVALHERLQLFD